MATAVYWDTDTSGRPAGVADGGQSTSALQAPTAYAGLYQAWNVDVDGNGTADAPWHFGTAAQYPALSLDADGNGRSTWREMGHQLKAGPPVTAVPAVDPVQVALTWTAVDASAWTPSPAVSYTVYRGAGGTVETVAAGVRGLRYVDRGMHSGTAYTYQVAAVVDGGEEVRKRPGDRRGAVRVCGDTLASGRAVAGRDRRAHGDDGTEPRVDGGERVGVSGGDGGSVGQRFRHGDLRGGGERGRPAHRRSTGGGRAGDGVPGVADGVYRPPDRAGGDAGQGAPLPGAAGADRRAARRRGLAAVRVDGPDAATPASRQSRAFI